MDLDEGAGVIDGIQTLHHVRLITDRERESHRQRDRERESQSEAETEKKRGTERRQKVRVRERGGGRVGGVDKCRERDKGGAEIK